MAYLKILAVEPTQTFHPETNVPTMALRGLVEVEGAAPVHYNILTRQEEALVLMTPDVAKAFAQERGISLESVIKTLAKPGALRLVTKEFTNDDGTTRIATSLVTSNHREVSVTDFFAAAGKTAETPIHTPPTGTDVPAEEEVEG